MVKIIENYSLYEQIGEGQYGKVYRGIDNKSKREVAVKVIHVNRFRENPKLQECTLNEIDVLSKIQSSHIVKFIQILKTTNNFYFFYEFCNEGTLEQRIKKGGPMSEQLVLVYLQQILDAFRLLSSRNIMHRDLKPGNILLHDGKIKIADFGFCKSLITNKDLAHTMLGSPIYMAPEVLKGQIYTVKADVWSLGVVLYEMLFGFCPYEESSIARLINLLDETELHFNRDINRISPQLEDLIRRMLTKDQFKRITWDEIFAYFPTDSLMKSGQLREVRGFNNGSGNKGHFEKQVNSPTITSFSIQRKNSQTEPQVNLFKKKNKENISTVPIDHSEQLRKQHLKLVNGIRHILELLNHNYCPEVMAPLAQKLLMIVQKELSKISPQKKQIFQKETLQLAEAIRYFTLSAAPFQNQGYLLNHYYNSLIKSYPGAFSPLDGSKDMAIHMLEMLEFNNLQGSSLKGQKIAMSKEMLLTEIATHLSTNQI